jgi:hypothetical protein
MHRAEPSPRAQIEELRALRGTFGRDAAARKCHLLGRLAASWLTRSAELVQFHDALLFAAAFPDNSHVYAIAECALADFAGRVGKLSAVERRKLSGSGMAGTRVANAFFYEVACWLVRQQEKVTIDWDAMPDAERLDPFLGQTLLSAEMETFESGDYSTREWVALASGTSAANALPWLLAAAPQKTDGARVRVWRDLYQAADVELVWDLASSRWSASRNRAPVKNIVTRRGFRRAPIDIISQVTTPLAPIRRLRGRVAEAWRDASIATLVARGREVLPTVCANVEEIYLAPLGKGVDLCVLGVPNEHRLPLEANYGYVMFSNGVPIGYGGVTALGAQANTGINIFESFRGSEAALLFAQSLRAFRTLFGVTRFIVNPYQIGADNDEALLSGSYWFYHGLGFRSRDPQIAALADAERARCARRRGRRTPLPVLRRLASADVVLEFPDAKETALFEERWVLTLGRAVATHFEPHRLGARQAYLAELSGELCALLTGQKRSLDAEERAGAAHLVPIIALLRSDLARWSAPDRAALWELVRLKGRAQERPFAQASCAHRLWWRTLTGYCRRLDGVGR